jgi:hypothetical protein
MQCLVVTCLTYCLVLKMEAVNSSETPLNFYRTVWSHIAEDRILQDISCSSNNAVLTIVRYCFDLQL